jgi:hypothetical protein
MAAAVDAKSHTFTSVFFNRDLKLSAQDFEPAVDRSAEGPVYGLRVVFDPSSEAATDDPNEADK